MLRQTLNKNLIIGNRYYLCTILDFYPSSYLFKKQTPAKVLCLCDCGNKKIIIYNLLKRGQTKSCGCLIEKTRSKHNQSRFNKTTKEYMAWQNMKARCNNINSDFYYCYGGRGIKYCERWETFENFFKDMGKKPSDSYSLDRIDVNGDYEPLNCRWATPAQQSNNKRKKREFKTSPCKTCDKVIEYSYKYNKRKYCSRECYYKAKRTEK